MADFEKMNTEANENGLDKDSLVGIGLTILIGAAGGAAVGGVKKGIDGGKKFVGWVKNKRENGKIEKEIRKQQNEELKEKVRKAKEESEKK